MEQKHSLVLNGDHAKSNKIRGFVVSISEGGGRGEGTAIPPVEVEWKGCYKTAREGLPKRIPKALQNASIKAKPTVDDYSR